MSENSEVPLLAKVGLLTGLILGSYYYDPTAGMVIGLSFAVIGYAVEKYSDYITASAMATPGYLKDRFSGRDE